MAPDSSGSSIARARVTREQERRSGVLDLGNLGLTEWPNELWDLEHLTCLNLGVGWTDEAGGFHFAEPGMAGADNTLPAIDARDAWARLPNLRVLSLAGSRGKGSAWSDLRGLENLSELRVLDLSWTAVDDLTPLSGLRCLEVLDASYTFVSNVEALRVISHLRHLDLSYTQVSDLAPLQGHAALRALLCHHTEISTVTPVAGMAALESLDLSRTRVTDLAPLAEMRNLQTLRCAWTPIESIAELVVRLPALETLVLHDTAIENVPADVLSPDGATNCLEKLRRYFATRS